MRHIANVVSAQVDRGFESRPLRHPAMPIRPASLALAVLLPTLVACRTTRTLRVTTEPQGALVRLDEDVIGRSPLEHEFVHGGQRRLSLYLPGYRTWSRRIDLQMPWYSRFPMDLVTELIVPLGLDHEFDVDVRLTVDTREDLGEEPAIGPYLERALELRASERAKVLLGAGGE